MFEGFFGELVVGIEVDEFACFLVKVFEFSLVGSKLVFVFFLVLVLKVFDLNEELLFEFISGDRGVVAFLWIGFGEFSIFAHVVDFISYFPVCFGDASAVGFIDGSAVAAGDEAGEGFVFGFV